MKVLELLDRSSELREKLKWNTEYYRSNLLKLGLTITGTEHPIVPVMVGDAALSQEIAGRMLELGVYVVGFFYPVVPKGQARIRTQVSAAHSKEDLDKTLDAWAIIKREFPAI